MRIREPVVAGRFYPADPVECRQEVLRLMGRVDDRGAVLPPSPLDPDGADWFAGIVPHAGWTFSGGVAGRVFALLARARRPDVVILFGGVHRYRGRQAALFGSGRWESPLGPVMVDERLGERILGLTNQIIDDPYAHDNEHSLEVQIPFVIEAFPGARIVPIMVPPNEHAPDAGDAVGRTLEAYQVSAVVIGTTDLTHYGPGYGFAPHGTGDEAMAWAKANDRPFLERLVRLQDRQLVAEAAAHRNACNAGAAAATVAAVRRLGGGGARLLDHVTSAEVAGGGGGNSVGYAGVVMG